MSARNAIRSIAPLALAIGIAPFACEHRVPPREPIAKPAATGSVPVAVSAEPSVDTSPSAKSNALAYAIEHAKICDEGVLVPRPAGLSPGGFSAQPLASATAGQPRLRAELTAIYGDDLGPDDAVAVMCRNFGEWKSCFTAADTPSTPIAGFVMLSPKVGADGHVEEVSHCVGSIDIPAVNDCLKSAVRRRTFRPPTPLGVAHVIFTFSYDHK